MDTAQAPHCHLRADRTGSDKSNGLDDIYLVLKKKNYDSKNGRLTYQLSGPYIKMPVVRTMSSYTTLGLEEPLLPGISKTLDIG